MLEDASKRLQNRFRGMKARKAMEAKAQQSRVLTGADRDRIEGEVAQLRAANATLVARTAALEAQVLAGGGELPTGRVVDFSAPISLPPPGSLPPPAVKAPPEPREGSKAKLQAPSGQSAPVADVQETPSAIEAVHHLDSVPRLGAAAVPAHEDYDA